MNTLVFQVVIKQWDKSQRSPEHAAARAITPERFHLINSPEFLILENQCLIDQHTLDFIDSEPNETSHIQATNGGRTLKKAMLADGAVKLDRLIIKKDEQAGFQLSYQAEKELPVNIGRLENGWLQAKYQWRHRVEKNNQIFWLYEEVTLNAAWVEHMKLDIFLSNPPAMIFKGV